MPRVWRRFYLLNSVNPNESLVSTHARRAFCVSINPIIKEKTMNRDILEKPFGPEQIKQREGNFGKKLDYIEGHAVIQRLNDAFDGDWSFTLTHHEILKETDEVIVIGQLNAGGIVKSQFGSSRITRARETGDIISLADDLKAAATDALKKAATLLGVGLHLYRNERPQGGNRNGDSLPNGGNRNGGNGNKLPVETETVGPIGQTVTAATVPTIIAEPETGATETAADLEAV
jgi:hypothetical protein